MPSKKTVKKDTKGLLSEVAGISSDIGGTVTGSADSKEKTRSTIATWFVFSFLAIIGVIPSMLLIFHTIKVDEYKDIILTLAGVLGGPLGIVITNYFKDKEDKS